MSRKIQHILLVTHYFPPLNRVPSLRVGQWAKYWAKSGVQVTVLTTRKLSLDGPRDLEMPLPDLVNVIEVNYIPQWLNKRLQNKQNQKVAANQQTSGTSPVIKQLKYFVRRLRKVMGSMLDLHDLWVNSAVIRGKNLLKEQNVDIIVSSYGPPASHKIAAKLKQSFPNIPWVADFRDLWANNHIASAKGLFRLWENWAESKTVGQYADILLTVSKPLAEDLRSRRSQPVMVVENGFDPDEFSNLSFEKEGITQLKTSKVTIVYTGTIYPGKRDPSPLFKAVRQLFELGILRKGEIQMRFFGDNLANLNQIVEQYDVKDFVDVCGHVDRQTALLAQRNADLLLLLEWGDPTARGVLTGKVFEYMASGKPIIGVGIQKDNAAGALIEETGTGLSCGNDVERIKKVLQELIAQGTWAAYQPVHDKIASYRRDAQAIRLLEIFSEL